MSMTAFELLGVLKLDKSAFDSGLSQAQSMAGKAGGVIGGALGMAAKTGIAALTAASGAAMGFVQSSMTAANSFESAFTGVRKTVDATEEEYANLQSWITDASTRMASSAEEIAGTMEIAGQLGIRGEEGLEKFTETMIMLGDTTNLNAEEAASALAKFSNIAGVAAEDSDRIGSAIVDLGNNFATTEADIVNMATRLASAGTIAGLSATDILALSTAMSSVGINAEAGGTAMSTIITKVGRAVDGGLDPANDKLQMFADVAGISAQEFIDAWKSEPVVALEWFVGGLDSVIDSGGNVTGILDELGIKGIREANTVRSLALASDVLTDAVNRADKAFEENVALQNEAELRYGTTESQMMQTSESFKNLQRAVGEELRPVYGELLSFSKEALDSMSKGFEEGGVEGLVGSFGDAISSGLGAVSDKLPEIFALGGSLLSAIGDGILQNIPAITTAAVTIGLQLMTGIVDAISGVSENAGKFMDAFTQAFEQNSTQINELGKKILDLLVQGLTEGIPQLLTFATDMLVQFAAYIGEHAQEIATTAATIVQTLAGSLAENLPTLINAFVGLMTNLAIAFTDPSVLTPLITGGIQLIMALLQGFLQALPQLIAAGPVVMQNLINGIVENMDMIVEGAVQLIGMLVEALLQNMPLVISAGIQITFALMEGILKMVPALLSGFISLMGEIVSSIIVSLPEIVEGGVRIVGSLIEGIVSMFGTLVENALALIGAWITGLARGGAKIIQAGKDMVDKVKEGIMQKISEAAQWGQDLISNFVGGIKDGWNNLKDTIGGAAQLIADNIGFSEPKEGPLSNFHTYAPDMMKLFAEGIKDNEYLIRDQLAESLSIGSVTANVAPQENAQIISLLQQIRDEGRVQVTLEGDADRLFRAMQRKATANYRLTGNPGLVTV